MDPGQIASAIQSASINRHPSPAHDINPSTAASQKIPVKVTRASHLDSPPSSPSAIPISIQPQPRRANIPPLPDLRFEQSYLASLPPGATTAQIAWITTRDQVFMPLVQGLAWTLLVSWWRHWNRGTQMVGYGVGARIRRWWWKVNNWEVPQGAEKARNIREFYEGQIGAGGD